MDDDLTVRLLAREALEQAGFVVEEAEDGAQGLAIFERLRPDLVLLGVVMPGMDGFSTCAGLRALSGGETTPVFNDDGVG